jgi:hypothetical protein
MRCTLSPRMPRNCSSSSCCWTRAHFGLAASHLHMSEPRASLTRSHFAGSASLLPRLAFRRTPWLRTRYGYRVPASAHARLYVVDLLGHSSTCRARQSRAPTLLLRRARTALPVRSHLPHLRRPTAAPEPVRSSPKPLSHRVSICRSRRALAPLKPTLLLFLLSRRATTWCRSYPRRLASGFRGLPAPAALRPPARLLPRTAWPLPRHALARTCPAWPASARPQPPACARACAEPPPLQLSSAPLLGPHTPRAALVRCPPRAPASSRHPAEPPFPRTPSRARSGPPPLGPPRSSAARTPGCPRMCPRLAAPHAARCLGPPPEPAVAWAPARAHPGAPAAVAC